MCTWQRYTTRDTPYGKAGNITLDEFSNGFTVKNTGNSICWLNSDPLQPGESKGIGGNQMEILGGRYTLRFTTPAAPPVGYVQQNNALVTEKYFLFKAGKEPQFNC